MTDQPTRTAASSGTGSDGICPECSSPFVTDAGRGRPRTYCSRACQVASYQARRDDASYKPTRTKGSGGPLRNEARVALSRAVRAQARAAEAQAEADAAEEELAAIHGSTEKRFGRSVPANALLLDALAHIEIEEGDRWRWQGLRNNKGLAVLKYDRTEKSLVRFLAIEFGLITEDDYGLLYPLTDTDDVNPWHRELRATESPMGNPARWTFTIKRAIDDEVTDG
jgi:hypothetical protein